MNCNSCLLMFNSKRKRLQYQCGYGFCQECLTDKTKGVPENCPIHHNGCKIVKGVGSDEYKKNNFDKKLKIVFVGHQSVGKTTLIQSLQDNQQNQNKLTKPKKTLSIDFVTVVRAVKGLTVQFNLWDTASQSTIFDQGYDLTFKNSDVQIIVFKDGQELNKIKYLYSFIEEKSQRIHVIIVENQTKQNEKGSQQAVRQILGGKNYQYLKINCQNIEEVSKLWKIIDNDCLGLKPSESKFKGSIIQQLQSSSASQPLRHSCYC